MKPTFPHYKQPDSKDCGPTCLRIIAKHYGKLTSLKEIREISETTREGSSLLKLSNAIDLRNEYSIIYLDSYTIPTKSLKLSWEII
ncbi:cysteine peptidase family C39 domain-containing protein [Algoriphagus faecimaris]|uniref:cysteine peptidase family C39 domain-containing protein n=1 Tax=Algoriphagus faecimaris TaxID=686796 RepID=UPI001F0A8B76|nr:cysteine peptidase family C39 domain-containing protein [Algoriphagus faecimaris]